MSFLRVNVTPLSPARWHSKTTYVSNLGLLGTTELNSVILADQITCTINIWNAPIQGIE